MRKSFLWLFSMFLFLMLPALASAQVGVVIGGPAVGVEIGVPPVCEYGYFDYYPYECAPYGFYGPDFFYNGIFIGVGPWWGWGYGHGWGGYRFHGDRYGYRHDYRYHGGERGYRGGERHEHGGARGGHAPSGHPHNGGAHSGGNHGGHK